MADTPQQQNTQPSRPWVKLHLAKQSDSCAMPPFIIGILQQELPTAFALTNVLLLVEDDEAPGGFRLVERQFPDYVYRTYVYRMEMLGFKPDIEEFGGTYDMMSGGGMG